jgi:hypothetical protein
LEENAKNDENLGADFSFLDCEPLLASARGFFEAFLFLL